MYTFETADAVGAYAPNTKAMLSPLTTVLLPVNGSYVITQPFHLDEEAAARTVFGGLVASGWHTVAISMRLLVTGELHPANGILGLGVEDLRWLKPVRPGDTLRIESEIVEVRPSMSRPDHGVVKIRHTTTNQDDVPVQVLTSIHLVARRPETGAPASGDSTR